MILLLDINVLLDVLLKRDPWAEAAAKLLSSIESKQANGFIAGHTLTTIYYVVAHARDRNVATKAVADLLRIVQVVPITNADFQKALSMKLGDFEDAVQAAAALSITSDYLVTRNEKDFESSGVPTAGPATVLALLHSG